MLRHRRILGEVLLCSPLLQVLALAMPLFFQALMDKVMVHRALATLDVLVLTLVVVGVLEVVLKGLREYLSAHTANRIDIGLGVKLFRHLLGLPLLYFKQRQVGVIIARGTVLYLGFLLTGISLGIVEGVTNPLVATLFKNDKRRMLTRRHAWWPMGLIVGGLTAWALGLLELPWQAKLAVVTLPILGYLMLVIPLRYPITERVSARVSSSVMFAQMKRPLFIVLMLLMWVTAATELAPDQWFAKVMADLLPQLGSNNILLLVYTAGLMFILRQYASSWVFSRFSPFAVLTFSAVLALSGLLGLGMSGQGGLSGHWAGAAALPCVTVFGIGKTFFWPTMLAITRELLPWGGALLINLMGCAGMLSVMVAVPAIGSLMDRYTTASALLLVTWLPGSLVIAFAVLWVYTRRSVGYRPDLLEAPH